MKVSMHPSYPGMAPTTVTAAKTGAFLTGKPWASESFSGAYQVLREELSLPESVPGGQAEYRMSLTMSFLFKVKSRVCSGIISQFPSISLCVCMLACV